MNQALMNRRHAVALAAALARMVLGAWLCGAEACDGRGRLPALAV